MRIFGHHFEMSDRDKADRERKLVQAFEELTATQIFVDEEHTAVPEISGEVGKSLYIRPGAGADNYTRYTTIESLLSFAVFRSPLRSYRDMSKDFGRAFDTSSAHNYIVKSCALAATAMDQLRCETLWSEIYAGSSKRMAKIRAHAGGAFNKENVNTPVTALLASLCGREDLVKDHSEYARVNEIVEYIPKKDARGGLILFRLFWEDCYKPWLDKHITDLEKELRDLSDILAKLQSGGEFEKTHNMFEEKLAFSTAIKERIFESTKSRPIIDFEPGDKTMTVPGKYEGEGLAKAMRDSALNAKKLVEKTRQRLTDYTSRKNHFITYVAPEKTNEPYYVDAEAVKQMSRLFRIIKEHRSLQLNESGIDIDFDELIQRRFNRSTDVFLDDEPVIGLDVMISIDCSSSMSGGAVQDCRNVCATIMKSIENVADVHCRVIGWYGTSYEDMEESIKTLPQVACMAAKQTDEARFLVTNGSTPAYWALKESIRVLQKMGTNSHKLLLVLTDGQPNSSNFGAGEEIKAINELVHNATQTGIRTIGLAIGQSSDDEEAFRTMFGTAYIPLGYTDIFPKLAKTFTKQVGRHLRIY